MFAEFESVDFIVGWEHCPRWLLEESIGLTAGD